MLTIFTRFQRCLASLTFSSALLAPFTALASPPQLPITPLRAGMHLIQAEVAADHASRQQGLMHRQSLAPNHGMLFLFEQAAIHCMWMRNTLIPLSVAFLDEQGVILNIETMEPLNDRSHCAAAPARHALEMDAGWFEKKGVRPGMRISGIPAQR